MTLKDDKHRQLVEFVYSWNARFPLDYWVRKKYNIRFGSSEHRSINLIDTRIEYEEDCIFRELEEKQKERKKLLQEYEDTGKFIREKEITEEELDEMYENLDISLFNKKNKE